MKLTPDDDVEIVNTVPVDVVEKLKVVVAKPFIVVVENTCEAVVRHVGQPIYPNTLAIGEVTKLVTACHAGVPPKPTTRI